MLPHNKCWIIRRWVSRRTPVTVLQCTVGTNLHCPSWLLQQSFYSRAYTPSSPPLNFHYLSSLILKYRLRRIRCRNLTRAAQVRLGFPTGSKRDARSRTASGSRKYFPNDSMCRRGRAGDKVKLCNQLEKATWRPKVNKVWHRTVLDGVSISWPCTMSWPAASLDSKRNLRHTHTHTDVLTHIKCGT